MPIRVAIIEDHDEYRESISYILQTTEGFSSVGKCSSVEEALYSLTNPDVILLDINLPGISGIEGIKKIKQKCPEARVVMLTVFDDDKNVFHAILAGADGYVLKKTQPLRLLQAIEDAATGGSPMTPSVAKQAMNLFRQYVPQRPEKDLLSQREREILGLLVEGLSNEAIAEKLFISLLTVRNHIRHIYEKLHVHSKSQAVVKAIKEGRV